MSAHLGDPARGPSPAGPRPDVAAELRRRVTSDQAARRKLLQTGEPGDLLRIDAENTVWLKAVIAEHGWPGFALVGEQGADDAWLLVLLYSLGSCRILESSGGLSGYRKWGLAC